MIITDNISKQFGSDYLFEGINISFSSGEKYGLIGANGSGKSTFIDLFLGFLKLEKGITKKILRDILSEYIPLNLFERPKQGFGIPISIWMKNELLDWTEAMLDTSMLKKHNLQSLKCQFYKLNLFRRYWEK